jgi:hypothetical protein
LRLGRRLRAIMQRSSEGGRCPVVGAQGL